MNSIKLTTQLKLSFLWIVVLFNMVFADVFSLVIELLKGGVFDVPGDVTQAMGIAAILTNICVLMIYLSYVLPYKTNRITNFIVAVFTMLYVIGGGVLLPHYLIMGGVEVLVLILMLRILYKWKK